MDWRTLPSLTSLRAFESAARLSSFTLAGRELNVTHAAVAQQVRGLEAELGLELIFRQGRGLAVTPEGAKLAQALAEGFRGVMQALAEISAVAPGAATEISASTCAIPRKPSPKACASFAPAEVNASPRPCRKISSNPNSASSPRTCCATAACVTFNSRPASVKLDSRAADSKARSEVSEGSVRQSIICKPN